MIYTVDRPEGFVIRRTFGLVEATTRVEISDRGALKRLFGERISSHQEALNALAAAGPDAANAIVGVRLSTATVVDGAGTVQFLLTYYGTPVLLEPTGSTPFSSTRDEQEEPELSAQGELL